MITLLQTLRQVAERSAIVAETDPHGAVISTVSIVAVFISLLILFLAYLFIGKCVMYVERREKKVPVSDSRPIHDMATKHECNLMTIRRKPKTILTSREDISRIGRDHDHVAEQTETTAAVSKDGTIKAPLPGVMVSVKVKAGDIVETGSELAVLEAMKMENTIESEYEGTVTEVYVSKGDSVLEGTPLMKIE